jgi:hypothetical protein
MDSSSGPGQSRSREANKPNWRNVAARNTVCDFEFGVMLCLVLVSSVSVFLLAQCFQQVFGYDWDLL